MFTDIIIKKVTKKRTEAKINASSTSSNKCLKYVILFPPVQLTINMLISCQTRKYLIFNYLLF